MAKISVLDFEIANLIAAGEVVERPSSVMKELIENSIDSGATKIIAEIKKGGVALIRVSDNGSGIDKDDLPVAIKRHATSKIKNRDDLATIMTLGFRGEALAAISSVSEMTIITKTKDADTASMLTAVGGQITDLSEVGAADGTTVVVENLFCNVPARRKFLKKDATEAANVSALIERVALSRPDISIQFLIDGEERFKTPGGGDILSTAHAVFGKDFASKLIKADGKVGSIRVHGYIGRSDNARHNRNLENVFINGRYVKSLTAMAAIEKAYTSYIAPECFPTCILFIEMDAGTVDVNVHPAKLEVKFSDEKAVFEAVYYTVKSAIENHEYRPEMELSAKRKPSLVGAFAPIGKTGEVKQTQFDVPVKENTVKFSESKIPTYIKPTVPDITKHIPLANDKRADFSGGIKERTTATPKTSIEILERYATATPRETPMVIPTPVPEVPKPIEKEYTPEYKIVGEAFDCYIIVEREGALLVIDKHAAHERIIFEELKGQVEAAGGVLSQTLLLPITVIPTADALAAVRDFTDDFKLVGFEFEFNGTACDITAIPQDVGAMDAEALFIKMADELADGRGNPAVTDAIRRERALYQVACKAAIKGGRHYNDSIVKWIVEKVLSLPDITVCPHGRPIAYKLTKNELDRQFDRIK